MPVSVLRQKAKSLLKGALKHAGSAALATALVSLGSVAVQAAWIQNSFVAGQVGGVSAPFTYDFTVQNTSFFDEGSETGVPNEPIIVDWELPFFALSDIAGVNDINDIGTIVSPDGWFAEIIQDPAPFPWDYQAANDPLLDPGQGGDPGLYGPSPQVFDDPPFIIHWFTTLDEGEVPFPFAVRAGEQLSGFGFQSDFSEQNAPYLTTWDELAPISGDPPIPVNAFGTPFSPARQQAQQQVIPEPSSFAVFGALVVVCAGAALWRRRSEESLTFSVDTDSVDC